MSIPALAENDDRVLISETASSASLDGTTIRESTKSQDRKHQDPDAPDLRSLANSESLSLNRLHGYTLVSLVEDGTRTQEEDHDDGRSVKDPSIQDRLSKSASSPLVSTKGSIKSKVMLPDVPTRKRYTSWWW